MLTDEVKKKIKDILHKEREVDPLNKHITIDVVKAEEELATLYTEMVEGELKQYKEWMKSQKEVYQHISQDDGFPDGNVTEYTLGEMLDWDSYFEQYLLERKGN